MLVVGIDPGTATTGYGFIKEEAGKIETIAFGVITTPTGLAEEERLLLLYDQLKNLFLLHQPDCGAVEKLFFQRNITSAIAVGQARGIVMLVFAQSGISVGEYTPLEVKQAVVGYGRAEKKQVQQMVKAILGLDEAPKPDDAADALAVAICHLNSYRFLSAQTEGE